MSEAVKEVSRKQRRQFRNIHITQLKNYRLPIAGFVSILHRISGFLMFLALPLVLYLFQMSVLSEDTFKHFAGIAAHPVAKLVTLALVWAFLQHISGGVRHLLMDLHMGLDKHSARKSGAAVLTVSLSLTFVTALKLFGVF